MSNIIWEVIYIEDRDKFIELVKRIIDSSKKEAIDAKDNENSDYVNANIRKFIDSVAKDMPLNEDVLPEIVSIYPPFQSEYESMKRARTMLEEINIIEAEINLLRKTI